MGLFFYSLALVSIKAMAMTPARDNIDGVAFRSAIGVAQYAVQRELQRVIECLDCVLKFTVVLRGF